MMPESPDSSAAVGGIHNFTADLRKAGFVVPLGRPFLAQQGGATYRCMHHLLSLIASAESLPHALRKIVAEGEDREAFLAVVELIRAGWIGPPYADHDPSCDWLNFLVQEGAQSAQDHQEVTLEARLNWMLSLGGYADSQALHSAAKRGDAQVLGFLIESGALNPNAINSEGMTPLACAAAAGQLEVVELLCAIPEIDPNTGNPLALALSHGHVAVFKVLLSHASISFDGLDLLGTAISNGQVEILDLLLRQDLVADWRLSKPLIKAVESNQPHVLKALLSLGPLIDCNEGTPLRLAVDLGHVEIVRALLEDAAGLDVNRGEPMSLAVRNGNLEIVELLLQKAVGLQIDFSEMLQLAINAGQVDVIKTLLEHAANAELDLPLLLRCAVKANKPPAVKTLLEYCADADLRDGHLLWLAVDKGSIEVVSLLLEMAPDLNVNHFESIRVERIARAFDVVEVTPLVKAVQQGRADMVERLARHPRLDPNIGHPLFYAIESMHVGIIDTLLAMQALNRGALNERGETALHATVRQDDPDLLKAVLAAGFDVNARNQLGVSALHLVIDKPQTESLQVLLSSPRLEINGVDREGDTALHHAVRTGYVDGVRLLLQHPAVDLSIRDKRGVTQPKLAKMMAKLWGNMQNFSEIEALFAGTSKDSGLSGMLRFIGPAGSAHPPGSGGC